MSAGAAGIEGAEVVLPCAELAPTLSFFTDRLGFRLDAIFPADDPAVAVLTGYGLRIRLHRGATGSAALLRLSCREPGRLAAGALALTAPNGTRIELADATSAVALPPLRQSFVVSRRHGSTWVTGRAGMRYRDLIPDRH